MQARTQTATAGTHEMTAGGTQIGGRVTAMDVDECRRLLAAHSFGRITVNDERGPVIFPVNYALDSGTVVLRTTEGTKLDAAVRGAPATFEIDHVDERQRTGWSVVVRGRAVEIEGFEDIQRARSLPLTPFAGGDREHFVRLLSAEITGFRIAVPPDVSRDPERAPDLGNVWYGRDGDDLLG